MQNKRNHPAEKPIKLIKALIEKHPESFKISALSTNTNIALLKQQIEKFSPEIVAVMDSAKADELKKQIDIPIYSGIDGLNKVATIDSSN